MFTEIISLVVISEAETSLAEAIAAGTKTTVFADKQSVRQSEFYQAVASGLNPEAVFIVRTIDYSDQACVEWGAKQFNIIRTYNRPDEMTELVCRKV